MSIESELAKRDKLLAEKSARIRELEHMVETRGESIRNLTELLDKCHARIRELEAQLGGGECEMVTSGTPCEGNTDKACKSCGAYGIGEYYDGQGHISTPKFCPDCGRKVKR